jgi:hypothetical protein
MRIVNFRDFVLWPIAYRLGLNPKFNLLADQASALAAYINSWVRRLWDSADWPEWTFIDAYVVHNHYVTWDQLPVPTNGHSLNQIGKVLKVYLLDPRITWAPVDTPFRLNNTGIHVGFEHGPHVWIKYVVRCPQYTSDVWNVGVTYNKDDLVYSPTSGECYLSKSNNNVGHDPSEPGGSDGPLLPLGIAETPGTPDNPGSPASTQIEDVFAAESFSDTPIADPPDNGVEFFIQVKDNAGAVLGDATHTASGSESLLDIFTDLQTQLAADLSTFTAVTLVTSPLKIRLEDDSDYVVSRAIFGISTKSNLSVVQAQSYSVSVPAAAGIRQSLVLTITKEQFIPGGVYTLTFTTVDSEQHIATYTSAATDNVQQVLTGIINAMIALQVTDPFFIGVHCSTDAAGLTNTFLIENQLGMVSLDGQVQGQGSTYWTFVPFPFSLVEQVVRGSYADALGEQGMTDKKAPEEAAVKTEHDVRTGAFMAPKHDALTDQYQGEGKRYELP